MPSRSRLPARTAQACRQVAGLGFGAAAAFLAPSAGAQSDTDPVLFKRGDVTVRAQSVEARLADERIKAVGGVELLRGGDRFSGSLLDFNTRTQTGFFLEPQFLFGRTGAGGKAERLDFLGPNRFTAFKATYSSCPIEDAVEPAWQLSTRRLTVNIAENEGIAEAAVLRFYGVPILAAPVLSFPVTDARKSGVLPPVVNLSNTSGFEFGTPYYFNIAENRDATLTPIYSTRRGLGLDSEFRYLTQGSAGTTRLFLLPHDQASGQRRWAFSGRHDGKLPADLYYEATWLRASDDDYWRDGLRGAESLTPRLLPTQGLAEQRRTLDWGSAGAVEQTLYARAAQWQVLQDSTTATRLEEPYRRLPQIGARWRALQGDLDWSLETEVNRFTHTDPTRAQGSRAHLLGAAALPLGDAGWRITPRVGVNAAAYDVSAGLGVAAQRTSRLIPTFSLDSQWTLDRDTELFGQPMTQTLEPRLFYVNTPLRAQAQLPLFDSAALDFNPTSVYTPSVFSGVDRVSDANQVTAGVSSRFISRNDGSELARVGVAQRYLLRDQLITPDGVPLTQHFSDLLLFGSSSAVPNWRVDGVVQYNPEIDRMARSILNLRFSPGPFRTLSASYRYQRSASEQLAVGWQWPLWGQNHQPLWPGDPGAGQGAGGNPTPAAGGRSVTRSASDCRGTLYGVGRLEYSLRDRRFSGSIAGLEYDAGCWVGRIVAQRKATGVEAQSTSLSLQLELIGLTRIDVGANPLSVLKDNIPGFRLLNDASQDASGSGKTNGAADGTAP